MIIFLKNKRIIYLVYNTSPLDQHLYIIHVLLIFKYFFYLVIISIEG